jgi:hypothetical protein
MKHTNRTFDKNVEVDSILDELTIVPIDDGVLRLACTGWPFALRRST